MQLKNNKILSALRANFVLLVVRKNLTTKDSKEFTKNTKYLI